MSSNYNKLTHIAIIMDGNGRWAKAKFLPRKIGHKKGSEKVEEVIKWCKDFGIKTLTLYAFSTENWQREADEIEHLFELLREYLKDKREEFQEQNIRFKAIGNITKFPKDIQEGIKKLEEETENNDELTLNIALNYGALEEVTQAVNRIINAGVKEVKSYEEFVKHLYLQESPDLLIRTGGQVRLSNFLLLQLAYTELFFTKTLWPDFSKKDFLEAIKDFENRQRNFGK